MGRLKDQSLNLAQVTRLPTNTRETIVFVYIWEHLGTSTFSGSTCVPQLENLIFVFEELEQTREQVEMMYTGTDR